MLITQKIFNKNTYANLMEMVRKAMISDKKRMRLLFVIINGTISLTSLVMTIVNICTKEYVLANVTLVFSVMCAVNLVLTLLTNKADFILHLLFGAEALLLLSYFIISGNPDGFSILWISLVPSFSLLIFGMKGGFILSLAAEAMLIFFLWTSAGNSFLQYDYGETFMLRFPFVYITTLVISVIMEYVRKETHDKLKEVSSKYEFLYRHDALTGLFNRFGMQEYFDNLLVKNRKQNTAIIMFDIDNFKRVNDTWGHECGDLVIKTVASVPLKVMCEHSHFCRWGGEEFLLLMQCSHVPAETAEKVRAAIEQTEICYNGESLHVTVSVGVGTAPSSMVTPDNIHDLISIADEALYVSKRTGKNKVTVKTMD